MSPLRSRHLRSVSARPMGTLLLVAAIQLLAGPLAPTRGQCSMHEVEMLSNQGAGEIQRLGRSIAAEGEVVVVGAPGETDASGPGTYTGKVLVFTKSVDGWSQQTIVAPGGTAGTGFGRSVALSGNRLFVGAPYDPGQTGIAAGAVHIYERNGSTWTPLGRVGVTDADARFGWSVATLNGLLVVGCPQGFSSLGVRSGTVYAYRDFGSGYTLIDSPIAQTLVEGALFGWSLATHGDTLVVGAKNEPGPGLANGGAVYVFERQSNSWAFSQRLLPAEPLEGLHFGYSVAVDADAIVVSSYGRLVSSSTSTNANQEIHTFHRQGSGWARHSQVLVHSTPFLVSSLPTASLAMENGLLGVGILEREPLFRWMQTGRAYLYEPGAAGWVLKARMGIREGQSYDRLGMAVAWLGDQFFVGATGRETANGEGAVYAFDTSDADGDGLIGPCDLCPAFAGGSNADPDGDGLGNACDPDMDGDALANDDDNCPLATNAAQDDSDADGSGDSCDPDVDGDAVDNELDNCPRTPNPDQADGNANGRGDICDLVQIAAPITVTVTDSLAGDRFGDSLAFAGDTLVVGAYRDHLAAGQPGSPDGEGSVHLFRPAGAGWEHYRALRGGLHAGPGDNFGFALAATPELIVVGAPGAAQLVDGALLPESGVGFVFRRSGDTWIDDGRLQSEAGAAAVGSRFGDHVIVSGSTVACTAPYEVIPGATARGAVYIFDRIGVEWVLAAKLTSPRPEATLNFGIGVALDGDHLLIGDHTAPTPGVDPDAGPARGAVYAYERTADGWVMQDTLRVDESTVIAMGTHVELRGDLALIGASSSTEDGQATAGCTYEFRHINGQWQLIRKHRAEPPVPGERYGFRQRLAEDVALIQTSSYPRRIDLFAWASAGWELQGSIRPADSGWTSYAIAALDPSRRWVAVGARGTGSSGQAESVQVYSLVRDGACCTPAGCVETTGSACAEGFVCDVEGLLPPTFQGCAGDMNGDGRVNAADRGYVRAALGSTDSRQLCLYDLTGDGRIDPADVAAVSVGIGQCLALPPHQTTAGGPSLAIGPGVFRGVGTTCDVVECP